MIQQPTFSAVDLSLIAFYFVAIVVLGIYHYRSKSGEDDFLIAGRRLSLGAFVATLVSTFYGGILGVGEFTYRFGLVSWFTQGFFYYVFAVVYAYLLAPKIRRNTQYTLPDQLYQQYDQKTGLLGALFTFILVTPAPYILMSGTMLHIIFGWSLPKAILIGAAFSTVYVLFGGLRSVIRTDLLQFALMFIGFGLVLPFAWSKLGSLPSILSELPAGHTTIIGKLSLQQVVAWGFIAMWTMVSPSFYQRCSAAKSESVARSGVLLSIFFWFLFDMMTLSAGLYARAALPHIDPVMAYPILGQLVLPVFFKGLFFIGMLATIMSTLDSLAFLSAITLGRDVLWRLRQKAATKRDLTLYTRIGLIISAVLAVVIAIGFKSVIDIWYVLGSLAIPILFLPLFTSFFRGSKLSARATFVQMALTGFISVGWMSAGYFRSRNGLPSYPLQIEPMYPGLIVSIFWWGMIKTKRFCCRNLTESEEERK